MNILFFSKYYFPHIGGVEKHAKEVAEGLVKRGHKVSIVTLRYDQKLKEFETKGGVKILRLPYSNKKTTIWKSIWQKKDLIKSADIIHCHDIFFWYWPFRLIYPFKKVFITFHGWEGNYPVPKKNIFIRKFNELLAYGNICVGDYLLKHYNTKTDYVTYGGCRYQRDDRRSVIFGGETNQIVFIGRLEKDLGVEEYLKALRILKAKHNLKITFVGDGSYRKQAQKLGTVTGIVKNIKPYLKKPCFVFTSSYLTILEAMAANRPVFSLYQNQLKKDYLTLFPGAKCINLSSTPEELVNQVKTSLRKQSSQVDKAYQFAQKQTWDKVINLSLKLWNQN